MPRLLSRIRRQQSRQQKQNHTASRRTRTRYNADTTRRRSSPTDYTILYPSFVTSFAQCGNVNLSSIKVVPHIIPVLPYRKSLLVHGDFLPVTRIWPSFCLKLRQAKSSKSFTRTEPQNRAEFIGTLAPPGAINKLNSVYTRDGCISIWYLQGRYHMIRYSENIW